MGYETDVAGRTAVAQNNASAPAGATRPSGQGYAQQTAALRPAPEARPVDQAVGNLGNLSGPAGSNQVRTSFDDPSAADPATLLPFDDKGGWDHAAILRKLGQADAIDATDSDGVRCVQAVSLASHILQGPADVIGFLGMSSLRGHIKGGSLTAAGWNADAMTPRAKTAMQVLSHVQQKIMARTATFGDLSWAQEALHALAIPAEKDNEGTPANEVMDNVNPGGVGADNYTSHAGKGPLREGLEHRSLRTFGPVVDGMKDGDQLIVLQYIQWTGSPAPTGHQLILFKDKGQVTLYDPQETDAKLKPIAAGGIGLERCFVRDTSRTKWIAVAGQRKTP